jgi:hypothetical protein
MIVKPAPGRAVRDPSTYELLPAEGRDVPDTFFWRRRLRDGDVVAAGTATGNEPTVRGGIASATAQGA